MWCRDSLLKLTPNNCWKEPLNPLKDKLCRATNSGLNDTFQPNTRFTEENFLARIVWEKNRQGCSVGKIFEGANQNFRETNYDKIDSLYLPLNPPLVAPQFLLSLVVRWRLPPNLQTLVASSRKSLKAIAEVSSNMQPMWEENLESIPLSIYIWSD